MGFGRSKSKAIKDYLKAIRCYDESLEELEVLFLIKEDLDRDNIDEIILGVGQYSKDLKDVFYEKIYVLSDQGNIEVIDVIQQGYAIEELKIIELYNSTDQYIYCGLTNMINRSGFEIYSMQSNQLISNWSSTSGIAQLEDLNSDGIYESYKEYRWSYDVLYYETWKSYNWNGESFELTKCDVDVGKYPEKLEEVILQYISLSIINNNQSKEVMERLKDIGLGKGPYNIEKIDHSEVLNTLLDVDEGILMDMMIKDNKGKVIVSNPSRDDIEEYKYRFDVVKIKGYWHIEDIHE